VALNAIGGIVFGWLYWRRSLEAAMVAHASAHVGFAMLRPLLDALTL
jgi:membrane protease YdiL (CAAX protease family)